jgi:hypothetical protein
MTLKILLKAVEKIIIFQTSELIKLFLREIYIKNYEEL